MEGWVGISVVDRMLARVQVALGWIPSTEKKSRKKIRRWIHGGKLIKGVLSLA
jgi:hypothetical protein